MAKILMTALIALMTLPAFANQSGVIESDAAFEAQMADLGIVTHEAFARRPGDGAGPLPPQQPRRIWICYTHDFFGGRYYGQSRDRRYAQELAMRACQAYSQTPVSVCFSDGCESRWY